MVPTFIWTQVSTTTFGDLVTLWLIWGGAAGPLEASAVQTWHSIIVQDDTKLTYSTDVGSIFYWHALYFYNVCHVT